MIYNFVLTHYAFEKSIADKILSTQFVTLLDNTLIQNIILIIDKNEFVWDLAKSCLKEIYKSSDPNFKKIENKLIEIRKKNKIFSNTTKYDEKNVELFLKSINDQNIDIDGIIVSDEEISFFPKTISIQNYNLESIEEERKIFFQSGLVDLNKKNRNELLQNLRKITWNSDVIYYFDYNLAKIKDNNMFQSWYHGFALLADAFSSRYLGCANKPKLIIFTPLVQSFNRKILDANSKKNLIVDHLNILNQLNIKIFNKIKEKIDLDFFYYESKDLDNPTQGNKGHNRYIQTLSTIIDIEDGLDIFDSSGKKVKFGDWTFAMKDQESLKNIRNLPKYNELKLQELLSEYN